MSLLSPTLPSFDELGRFPQTLSGTTFKKNYNFLWLVSKDMLDSKLSLDVLSIIKTIFDVATMVYVSQMAEKVGIPDDEIEYETVKMANLEYRVPRGIKMNDFQVTYLDDSINSVYMYHKKWQMQVRNDALSMYPLVSLCASGWYVTTEKDIQPETYETIYKNYYSRSGKGLNEIRKLLHAASIVPTSITQFPNIYPIKISRTEADKAGDGLAKVTVTYARLPNFKRNRNPLLVRPKNGNMFKDAYAVSSAEGMLNKI